MPQKVVRYWAGNWVGRSYIDLLAWDNDLELFRVVELCNDIGDRAFPSQVDFVGFVVFIRKVDRDRQLKGPAQAALVKVLLAAAINPQRVATSQ